MKILKRMFRCRKWQVMAFLEGGTRYCGGSFCLPRLRSAKRGHSPAGFSPHPFPCCEAPRAPRRGDPRRGSPREKTVNRTVFSPRPALRFALPGARLFGSLRGDFALCGVRRGAPPPRPRGLLKKAGENFYHLAQKTPPHFRRRRLKYLFSR